MPHPNPKTHDYVYPIWQRRIKIAEGCKIVNLLALNKEIILGYPGRPMQSQACLEVEEGGRKRDRKMLATEN